MDTPQDPGAARPFLERHEFLIRRLHSLSGLVPVGAYMCVHLLTNASVLNSPNAFQRAVYMIHSLDQLLPVVEWLFIFLPILFHAIIGVVIVRGGLPNSGTYRYARNVRYTLQRATGMIAFVFILFHVFHMHGWFHFDWWMTGVVEPLGGGQFKPYSAASTLGLAMRGVMPLLYAIGVLSCVFHLANGLWTMGITWGIWISPAAQRRAELVCAGFGAVLAAVSMGALVGAVRVNTDEARIVEDRMYKMKTESGEVRPNEHKRAAASHDTASSQVTSTAAH